MDSSSYSSQQNAAEEPHRTVTQILIKTLLIHIFAIANYGHLGSVLRIPAKHNAHIFRLVIFLFFPTIALAAVIIDALHALSRFLQNPDETSLPALKYYLHGITGVRASRRDPDNHSEDAETSRLLQLGDIESARHEPEPWTWKRIGRIIALTVVMAQGAGTIALWARRVEREACISIDSRNFYMACGSVISSILSLLLLTLGNKWSYTPALHGHLMLPRWPETRRLLVEVIIAGVIQEAASHFVDDGDILPVYATSIWGIFPGNALEVVLWSILALGTIVFRKEIEGKLGFKLQPIGLLLLGVACGWVVVDAIGLIVVDIVGLVNFDPSPRSWGYRRPQGWSDPLEQLIPVI